MTPTSSIGSASNLDHSSAAGMVNAAASSLSHAGEQASHLATDLATRGAQALRDGSNQLQDRASQLQHQAQRGAESTVTYIKEEPLKAMLMAAASGAVLMGLIGLISRTGHRN
jgi:X-X-X-Leu-X-X-Gly heptad repeat protein